MSAREEVARLLAEHSPDFEEDGYGGYLAGCVCGWPKAGTGAADMAEAYAEHQAEALDDADLIGCDRVRDDDLAADK